VKAIKGAGGVTLAQIPETAQYNGMPRSAVATGLVDYVVPIIYYFGPIERYLKQPAGAPTDDLMIRAREGLGIKLRAVIQNAFEGSADSQFGVTQIQDEGATRRVKITVNPVMSPRGVPSLLLVSFEDETERAPSADVSVGQAPSSTDSSSIVQQLESELQATREDLQSTVEEMESSNEELKAANEEVMSVNEELQSTNEELETSKEELQSLNEELITVNSQLEEKVSELVETTDVLDNLLSSTATALCYL
jgi:two-component system CheB/CheR fusion protein